MRLPLHISIPFVYFSGPGPSSEGHLEYVILLHGLARSSRSMKGLGKRLMESGYGVANIDYASRSKTIEEIADEILPKAITWCREKGAKKIHFVTHSMGGIVVRYFLKNNKIQDLGRVVMLSPPNGGSKLVDALKDYRLFRLLNGPAGRQLTTDKESMPQRLGPVDFELGIITGDRSINLLLSLFISGDNDGKVSVESAKVVGMKDFTVIHATHPFIMNNRQAMEETLSFLRKGRFMGGLPAQKEN